MKEINGNLHRLPKVTIGIPTYNRADGFLSDAIESAISQTFENIEVLIADNCSNDHTSEIVGSFRDSRIRYHRHDENIGANNNFNFCIRQAKGKYFLLLSDDDLIDADMIEKCMASVGEKDVGVISTGVRIIDGAGRQIRAITNPGAGLEMFDYLVAWLDGKIPFYLCGTLYNTARLNDHGGLHSKTNLYQDVAAAFSLMAGSGRSDIYDVKASFRTHPDNRGSKTRIHAWCEDSQYLLELMSGLVDSKGDVLMEKGKKVLAMRNYRKAAKIRSPIERYLSYRNIHKSFGGCVSPMQFIFETKIKRRLGIFK